MKKYGLMTFHFAHNFGAMLQAYALKEYLSEQKVEASFINYVPQNVIALYSLNPLAYGFHPRVIIKKIKALPLRAKQHVLFEKFKRDMLGCYTHSFSDNTRLEKELSNYDCIVYGSDQIWNLDITKDEGVYFGKGTKPKTIKVAYAASVGASEFNEEQALYVSRYLSEFDSISVREDTTQHMLMDLGVSSIHVCDPVFLLSHDKWKELTKGSQYKHEGKYILYYILREDEKLRKNTELLSERLKIPVIAVHPNGNRIKINGTQLNNIGPVEFLCLIDNAEFVCTNSFHATAFSVIFGKKLVHESFEGKGGRVQSLLGSIDADKALHICLGQDYYDCKEVNKEKLIEFIQMSKKFIDEAV